MQVNSFIMALVTCPSQEVAEAIIKRLLSLRLIACGKYSPAHSMFHWKDTIDRADEIMVFMETVLDNFDRIEQELRAIHPYEVFVATALPIVRVSTAGQAWLQETLQRANT